MQRTPRLRIGSMADTTGAGSLIRVVRRRSHPVSDYPTCAKTFATFRVYHDIADPQAISNVLGITPTRSWRRGDSHGTKRIATYPTSGWFLSSEHAVASHDSLRHIEWLLAIIEPRRAELHALREQGHRLDISCYWLSESGHGGPTLIPDIMRRLAELAIPVWFDVYFTGTDETHAAEQERGTEPGPAFSV